MSSQPTLRLIDDSALEPDSYVFDRRRCMRRRASGTVTAVSTPSDDSDAPKRIRSLQLIDSSETGVGAIMTEEIDLGSRIVMFFPSHGNEKGFDLVGHVVRCHQCKDGYRVGVKLKSAAAPVSAA
ncbi:PilZ domain-containing protein [Planctomycetota bacterium]|nr:PilZ domain-containing protein [Planctomycetota bacterium]